MIWPSERQLAFDLGADAVIDAMTADLVGAKILVGADPQ